MFSKTVRVTNAIRQRCLQHNTSILSTTSFLSKHPQFQAALWLYNARHFSFSMQKKSSSEKKPVDFKNSIPFQNLPTNSVASIKNGGLLFVKDLNARMGSFVNIHSSEAGLIPAIVLRSTARGVLVGLLGAEQFVHRGDIVSLPNVTPLENSDDPTAELDDITLEDDIWPKLPTGPTTLGHILTPSGSNIDYSFADVLPPRHSNPSKIHESIDASPVRQFGYLTRAPGSFNTSIDVGPNMKLPITAYAQPTSGSQLFTGMKFFDSLHPIRRGTRLGVVGHDKDSLTQLAIEIASSIALQNGPLRVFKNLPKGLEDTPSKTISSTSSPTVIVYAIIGQTHAHARRVIEALHKSGALAYTTVIFADSKGPIAEQYLALQAAQVAANSWRARGHHCFCIIDDLSAHAKAVDAVLRTSNEGGKDVESASLPLNVSAQQAALLDGFGHLVNAYGAGSSTALSLFVYDAAEASQLPIFDARRVAASLGTLRSASDSFLTIDKEMGEQGIFPAIMCTPGSQNMRYLYPAMRPLVQSLNTLLLAAKEASTTVDLGGQLGFEPEDDHVVILNWRKKLSVILSQEQGTFTPLPIQYLLLAAATRPNLLTGVPLKHAHILEQFLVDLASEEGDLMERLKNEIMVSAICNQPLPEDHINGLSFKLGIELEKFFDEALFEFNMQFNDEEFD